MTDRSVQHTTFSLERTYDASPARVYAAWSQPEAKAAWFVGDPTEWQPQIREMDFRIGGHERVRGLWPNGRTSDFRCHYLDIVPERRIVYSYDMYVDDKKISISLATIEILPAGQGTRMIVTEQGAYIDAPDDPIHRERGTQYLMDRFGAALRRD